MFLKTAEAVARLSNLFISKAPAWRIATSLKQKLRQRCFLWLFQILKNTYFVEFLRTAVSEKQMNYWFNVTMVLLKTLLTIYPKNDKQNIVIKVCSHSTNLVFLNISQTSQENTCDGVFFLNKFASLQPTLYLTWDSSTGAFL